MASDGLLSVASFVEDVIKQHGTRLSDIDLASRKAEEAATRRYEAAAWLRRTVGAVGAKDLAEEPSEDEFRFGLRNGMILCNALNKVIPGVVPKVVEIPVDSNVLPDGAAISAYQYFENVRNFLVVMQDLGLPTFEASDLEQGGKGSKVVNSVLALKSHCERSERRNGSLKHGGISKPASSGKYFMRKSEPFMNSLSKNQAMEQNLSADFLIESTDMTSSQSLNMLVSAVLSNKKPEEVPLYVESMLSKVMQEFERRLASQKEQMRITMKDLAESNKSFPELNVPEVLSRSFPGPNVPEVSSQSSPEPNVPEVSSQSSPKPNVPEVSSQSFPEPNVSEVSSQTLPEPNVLDVSSQSFPEPNVPEVSSPASSSNSASVSTKMEMKDISSAISKEKESPTISRKEDDSVIAKIEKDKQHNSLILERENLKKNVEELAERERRLRERLLLDRQQREIKVQKQRLHLERQQREIQEMKNTLDATRAAMELLKGQYYQEFGNLGKHFKVLAHAASGYRKVLEENRKLYNQVQDLKGNIRVYCRVRPFLPGQASGSTTIGRIDDGNITIVTPAKYGKEVRKSFTFNRVFGSSASQGEVFVDTQPLIRSVLDGYNVCIFAYGQTGSGKTFTMTGPKELSEETLGVNYRALNDLFSISEQRKDTFRYEISVQVMEIYNEQVRDLLVTDGQNKKLEIRNNSQNGISVPDANMVPVSTTSDVIDLMNLGHKNRAVCSTAMNDRSSRSHSCVTVHVQGRDLTSGTTIRGSMHLVDLAGSERVDKSEVKGASLKEAVHINKSLSALGDVIAALAQKNAHVPYRNSKLTQLLQDSLGGQAKTLMFVHISPEVDAIAETLSTLKFAERVSTIELGAAKSNKETPEVKELKEQIASLKVAALGRKAGDNETIRSTLSSPDIFRMSPSGSAYEEEVQTDSPPWKGDEKEVGSSGEWVDKVMVNKHGANGRDEESLRDWEGDSTSAPPDFYQRYLPDVRSVTTDDSDDLEIATSDSSEADMLYQFNPSKIPSLVNGGGATTKKPQSKPLKSPDTRAPSRSHIPSPTPARKTSSGPGQSLNRTGKHGGIDGKRPSSGKTGSGK